MSTTTGPDPIEVPCTIHTHDAECFIVADVGAWQYQDWGVFASGRWRRTSVWTGASVVSEEQDVLLPYSQIKYIEFDFAALERYHAAQLIESIPQGTFSDDAEPTDEEPDES